MSDHLIVNSSNNFNIINNDAISHDNTLQNVNPEVAQAGINALDNKETNSYSKVTTSDHPKAGSMGDVNARPLNSSDAKLNAYVAHSYQTYQSKAGELNQMFNAMGSNPLERAPLSAQLESMLPAASDFNLASAQDNATLSNIEHNLNAFIALAQDSTGSNRASCASFAISYLSEVMSSLNDSTLHQCAGNFIATTLSYLASDNASSAQALENNLNELMHTLSQSSSPVGTAFASLANNFISSLIEQKHDSLQLVSQAQISASGEVSIEKSEGLFAKGVNEDNSSCIVCAKQASLTSLGGVVSDTAERLNGAINDVKEQTQKIFNLIANGPLELAQQEINNLKSCSQQAAQLMQESLNQEIFNQSVALSNNILNKNLDLSDLILTPHSVIKKARKSSQGVTTNSTHDINDFSNKPLKDLINLQNNLRALSKRSDSKDINFARSGLNNDDVFNNTALSLLSKITAHKHFDEHVKASVDNLYININKDMQSLEELKLDPEAALNKIKSEYQAQNEDISVLSVNHNEVQDAAAQSLELQRTQIQGRINTNCEVLLQKLADGLNNYIKSFATADDYVQSHLSHYGIDKKNPLGNSNGGLRSLLKSLDFKEVNKSDNFRPQLKLTPVHIMSTLVKTVFPQPKAAGNNTVAPSQSKQQALFAQKLSSALAILDNDQALEKDKHAAFDQCQRVLSVYDALRGSMASVASALGHSQHPDRYETATATDGTAATADASAVEALAQTELSELIDVILNNDNQDLCSFLVKQAINSPNDELQDLLENLNYSANETSANRLHNTLELVSNLALLQSNDFFAQLMLGDALEREYATGSMRLVQDYAYKLKQDPSVSNFLDLALSIKNLNPVQDIKMAKVEANNTTATATANVLATSEVTANAVPSGPSIADLQNDLNTLQDHLEGLVDCAYSKFQLDKGIRLDSRKECTANAEFYQHISAAVGNNDEYREFLISLMSDGAQRSNSVGARILNSIIKKAANTAYMPNVTDLADKTDSNINMMRNLVRIIDFYYRNNPKEGVTTGNKVPFNLAERSENFIKNFALDVGNDKRYISIGLAYLYGEKVANITYSKDQLASLDKKYLSKEAIEKNFGEGQAASLLSCIYLATDSSFSEVDITDAICAQYVTKHNLQNNDSKISNALSDREQELLTALDMARQEAHNESTCSCLLQALYKEYQKSHSELAEISFHQLSKYNESNTFKDMLDGYYTALGMEEAPQDLLDLAPLDNSQVAALSLKEKAKIITNLAKNLNANLINIDANIKKEALERLNSIADIYKSAENKALTDDQKKNLTTNYGALYGLLNKDKDLLTVCHRRLQTKPLASKETANDALSHVASKIFGSKSTAEAMLNQQLVASLIKDYSLANVAITNQNISKQVKIQELKKIKENYSDNLRFDSLINLALLKLAPLFGAESSSEALTALAKNMNITGMFAGQGILDKMIPLSKDQLELLKNFNIECHKGTDDNANSQATAASVSSANMMQDVAIKDQIVINLDKDDQVSLRDLLAAFIATNIDTSAHNKKVIDEAKERDFNKFDAEGRPIGYLAGSVTSMSIARGVLDVASEDALFATQLFGAQIGREQKIRKIKAFEQVVDNINKLIDCDDFKTAINTIKEDRNNALSNKNIAIILQSLESMEDNSALTFNQNNEVNLLSLKAEAKVGNIESAMEASIALDYGRGFALTKENGQYIIRVSQELSSIFDTSASVKYTEEHKVADKAQLVASGEVSADLYGKLNTQANLTFTFSDKDKEKAAELINNLVMHKMIDKDLNNVQAEIGGSAGISITGKAHANLLVSYGASEDNGEEENKIKLDLTGVIPQVRGTEIKSEPEKEEEEEQSNTTDIGLGGSVELTVKGEVGRAIASDAKYNIDKVSVKGELTANAGFSLGKLAADGSASFQKSALDSLQYNVSIEVKTPHVNSKVAEATREESYDIKDSNHLAMVLKLHGASVETINACLKAYELKPMTTVSFTSALKPELTLKRKDPRLDQSASYNLKTINFTYSEEQSGETRSFGVFSSTNSQGKIITNNIDISYFNDGRNAKKILDKLAA